jgi:alkylation response protein AidB-like acyl-CoA dehydrogenase
MHAVHDACMTSEALLDPERLLAQVADTGWLQGLLPREQGGQGWDAPQAAAALMPLAERHPAAAWLAWSQGLVVHALVQSPNVAVRETVLPELLAGHRGGAVSWASDFGLGPWPHPVQAEALARGWHLNGQLEQVVNLQWAGYVVLCPVWFVGEAEPRARLAWTLLRSEEDGLHHTLDRSGQRAQQAAFGTVQMQRVYFREDELLHDHADALSTPLRLMDQALRQAILSAQLR